MKGGEVVCAQRSPYNRHRRRATPDDSGQVEEMLALLQELEDGSRDLRLLGVLVWMPIPKEESPLLRTRLLRLNRLQRS